MLSYDNVTLVPRVVSDVKSREDVDTSVSICNVKLDVPIIASPMPDVCGADMAFVLKRCGSVGIIHRFQTIEEQLKEFLWAKSVPETSSVYHPLPDIRNYTQPFTDVWCAIGMSDDYEKRFDSLYEAGCRVFCIDTANGANRQIIDAVKRIKSAQYSYAIAGNVATWQGYEFLTELGVDAVRVGVGGGSVCETRTETGVYMPTLESVRECAEYADRDNYVYPLIIADGGIRAPSDMAKALAVGASAVMGGRIFAGHRETPGSTIKDRHDKQLYKLYRGAASYGVQKDTNGEKPDYSEGAEELVPFIDKSVVSVIKRFKNGFRSTMSYMNAKTISEFRMNVRVEKL